jgi:hypothetical protein
MEDEDGEPAEGGISIILTHHVGSDADDTIGDAEEALLDVINRWNAQVFFRRPTYSILKNW